MIFNRTEDQLRAIAASMWTGDHTVSQLLGTQEQDSLVLASVAEAIAMCFPPLTSPASTLKKATTP
jgi:hypothetical protein